MRSPRYAFSPDQDVIDVLERLDPQPSQHLRIGLDPFEQQLGMKRGLDANQPKSPEGDLEAHDERPQLDSIRGQLLDFEEVVDVVLLQWGVQMDVSWYVA